MAQQTAWERVVDIDRPAFRFGVMYECRRLPGDPIPMADLYGRHLDQAVLADQLGFDSIWFTEHHFMADGYLPAFQPLAGAIAARTTNIRLSTDIAVLPLHHPVRLAEEMAVLDNISHGRMELGVGAGYVPLEFEAFGVNIKHRPSLMEEAVQILRLAWGDGPFTFIGRRYDIPEIDVHPKPVQVGGPPLWMAAMQPPAAERAARLGLNLLPQLSRSASLDPWRDALGPDAAQHRVGLIRSFLVTDDPERDGRAWKDAERYRMAAYSTLFAETPDDYGDGWRADDAIPQKLFIGDADACVAEIDRMRTVFGITDLVSAGLPPGVDPDDMAGNLERLAHDVLPRVRDPLVDPDQHDRPVAKLLEDPRTPSTPPDDPAR
jgi:alkanesulfonate monooxygenase SsuD/methylene tetrahydromethanopterin reductase-like flavin-dependent oxidoreductase (luciferase family)